MRFLCTEPLSLDYSSEFEALGAAVTTLTLNGIVELDDGAAKFDGAMITSEAFKLFFQGGPAPLAALYNALAELVRAGRVGWVHICASGVDVPIFFPLMKACHETSVTITHCPGVYAVPMAQYCISHILAIGRMHREHAVNQAARKYESLIQRDIRRNTVGIVGAGGIGTEVARLSKALGMSVLGWRRNATPAPDYDEVLSGPEGLTSVLGRADFVVICIPKTPATEGLMNAEKFALMKPSAWLINVARGKVLDEALKDNHMYFLDNVGRLGRGEPLKGYISDELMAPAIASTGSAATITGS